MSQSIKPENEDEIGGEVLREYELPVDDETVLYLDTSVGEGYSVEWAISDDFGVDEFIEFIQETGLVSENTRYIASYVDQDEWVETGDPSELLHQNQFRSACTYLRAESTDLSIEWMSDSYYNEIIFSSDCNNQDKFQQIIGAYSDEADLRFDHSYQIAVQEALQVISEDCGPGSDHRTE